MNSDLRGHFTATDVALLFPEYFPDHPLVLEMSKSTKSKPSGAEKRNTNKLGLFTMGRSTVSQHLLHRQHQEIKVTCHIRPHNPK